MKSVERTVLKVLKAAAKKQSIDPPVPGCIVLYHQPKRKK